MEQKYFNTPGRKDQDTTKKTSALADSCTQFLWLLMPSSMTALTWMVKSIHSRNTIEDFIEEIDEAEFVRKYNSSHLLLQKLYLCLALMNLFLGAVLSQVRDSPLWIRDFLLPPDMLAMRTAGPDWNHSKLHGSFAAVWFSPTVEVRIWASSWMVGLCCNLRQRFGYYECERWPLDDDWLREDYY